MPFIGLSKPKEQRVYDALNVGDAWPQSSSFMAKESHRVVAFLRHIGCPFSENTVKQLREWSEKHKHVAVFIVVHGDGEVAKSWLHEIGGLGDLHLIIDVNRELYGRWGIGYGNAAHFLGFRSLAGAIALRKKGIRNRSASGTRWQSAAMFVVDENRVLWAHKPHTAEEFCLPPETIF